MGFLELFIIAVGLSMDAFAVAICKGLSMPRVTFKSMITIGLYFGIFQGLMPLIGYLLGFSFAGIIESYDHWIAFFLLLLIGGKMVKESLEKGESTSPDPGISPSKMLPLAVATSIDALAAGVSFAFLRVNIVPAVLFIGVTTLCFSMAGVKIGNVFGAKYKSKAELAGGLVLILMGTKILLQHLEIINF